MSHADAGLKDGERAGDLAQLVSVEQTLEQRLDQARTDARVMVEEAVRECQALVAAYEGEFAGERSALQARIDQEQRKQEAQILAAGRERAARYDTLSETTVAELAAFVQDCVLPRSVE